MMTTRDKILSAVEEYNMVSPGDTVVLGVSGGADSMCLLHFFNDYSRQKQLNLIVAHVNHLIRGEEADRDQEFVRSYCEKRNITFALKCVNVPSIAKERGESLEECGRRERYDFFSSLGDHIKIATAHNLNDCAETVIFNLARGTGLRGLSGIPAVRGNIIRPLIRCTRAEIEEYLRQEGVSFVTDSTNLDDDYARNKIRHSVIPVLRQLNPSFESALLSCSRLVSQTADYMEDRAAEALCAVKTKKGFLAPEIAALPKALRDEVLKQIALFYGAESIGFLHIRLMEKILTQGGGMTLPGDIRLFSDKKELFRVEQRQTIDFSTTPYDESISRYTLGDSVITLKTVDKSEIDLYNNRKILPHLYIDGDVIKNAVFRKRREGDRFLPPGAKHSKTLKNLFREKGVEASLRGDRVILAGENEIYWIEGIGASAYATVNENSKTTLKIESSRKDLV